MDYSILKQIIALLEEYESYTRTSNLENFIIWLNNKLFSLNHKTFTAEHDNLMIAYRIISLNKELKKLAKKELSRSQVSSIDEYSFLLHLKYQKSLRKMELIEMHNLEAPTGIEIIKRLLKKGLIEEKADKEDRRAKRIYVTRNGEKEIKELEPIISKIFFDFTQNLGLNEKIHLAGMLEKITTS